MLAALERFGVEGHERCTRVVGWVNYDTRDLYDTRRHRDETYWRWTSRGTSDRIKGTDTFRGVEGTVLIRLWDDTWGDYEPLINEGLRLVCDNQ